MVLLSAATAGAAARVFRAAGFSIVTTDFNMAEVREHLPILIEKYRLEPDEVADALAALPLRVYRRDEYKSHLVEARGHMEKKDPDDVALLALALKLGIDIWSQDSHYDNLTVARVTTGRLLKSLGQ